MLLWSTLMVLGAVHCFWLIETNRFRVTLTFAFDFVFLNPNVYHSLRQEKKVYPEIFQICYFLHSSRLKIFNRVSKFVFCNDNMFLSGCEIHLYLRIIC